MQPRKNNIITNKMVLANTMKCLRKTAVFLVLCGHPDLAMPGHSHARDMKHGKSRHEPIRDTQVSRRSQDRDMKNMYRDYYCGRLGHSTHSSNDISIIFWSPMKTFTVATPRNGVQSLMALVGELYKWLILYTILIIVDHGFSMSDEYQL